MRINSSYNKVDIEKRSMKMMALSILAPAFLLVIVTIVTIYFASFIITTKEEEQLDLVTEAAAKGLFIGEDSNDAEKIFSSCKVLYFDENGELISSYELGFSKQYDETLKHKSVTVGGVRYKVSVSTMKENALNAKYVMVYNDVSHEMELYRLVVWVAVSVFVIAFAILALATYFLEKKQIDHYDQALQRNNQLVSDISHEFNTPLAIIKASLAKVMAEPDKKVEDVSDSLVTVTHEAGRLNRMVRDMLILSRSDSEKLILEKRNCDITSIVKDVIEPFQMMCELDDKTMEAKITDGIVSRTDEDKLRQAIIILLDNAVKYTKPGDSISVTLKDGFGKYTIIVADTGIGVEKDELQNIFERFYRTDNSRNSETGGSGLGLSIVKAIMLSLKGRVSAYQNKPKGFKVELEFPKEKFT